MATTNAFNATYPASSRRSYMSIRAFHQSFFSYSTSMGAAPSFTVTGSLDPVTSANSSTCPAGRVLRETGKKLFPGANPGVNTLMVGVYDLQSGLKGFIDPNDSVFTIYNTDRPVYLNDAVSATDDSTVDKAPGVYTLGDVTTNAGNITATTGDITATTGSVTGASIGVTSSAIQTLKQPALLNASITADCSLSSMFVIDISASTNFGINASNVSAGQTVYFIFNNTGAFTPTIVMGDNIRENSNGAGVAQSLVLISGRSSTMSFIGYGSDLCELSRSSIAPS